MKKKLGFYDFSTDEKIFGSLEPKNPSWFGHNVLMKVYDGKKLSPQEQRFFGKITGGLSYKEGKEYALNWLLLWGRGGGKTRWADLLMLYRVHTFNQRLHPGQSADNIILAPSIQVGLTDIDYLQAMIEDSSYLSEQLAKPIIKNSQMGRIEFKNHSSIRLAGITRHSGRSKSVWTLLFEEAAHCKELGRFSAESAWEYARPGMARFNGSFSMITTTAGAKGDWIGQLFDKHFGKENSEWLITRASSLEMNPTLSEEFLRAEEADNPISFQREYECRFTDTAFSGLDPMSIEDCIVRGRSHLPYAPNRNYFAFIRPSPLSRNSEVQDEMVLTIGHCEAGALVQDLLKAWSSGDSNLESAIAEMVQLCKQYRVRDVMGDRFGSGWIESKLTEFKFSFCRSSKSLLYSELMPILNANEILLVDEPISISQLKFLERKRSRDGTDYLSVANGKADARACAVAGLSHLGKEFLNVKPISLSDVTFGGRRESVVREVFGTVDTSMTGDFWNDIL